MADIDSSSVAENREKFSDVGESKSLCLHNPLVVGRRAIRPGIILLPPHSPTTSRLDGEMEVIRRGAGFLGTYVIRDLFGSVVCHRQGIKTLCKYKHWVLIESCLHTKRNTLPKTRL